MSMRDYWREAVATAMEEAGVEFSDDQLGEVTDSIIVSIENEGLASGRDSIPNPQQSEIDRINRLRAEEQRKAAAEISVIERNGADAQSRLRRRIYELQSELEKVQA